MASTTIEVHKSLPLTQVFRGHITELDACVPSESPW